jgi:hypothetical protein
MDNERVENFLAHYASKYYDPAKAHEYYLRNRELKGRENAGLSKESRQRQSEGVSYVSNEIAKRRQAELDANTAKVDVLNKSATEKTEAYQARVEKLQADAQSTRDEIVKKLNAYLEQVTGELRIPANASPKLRAFLARQNAIRSNSAQAKASAELGKIRNSIMASIEHAREEYAAFREGNTTQRRDAATERRAIAERYRQDYETEKKNIKEQVR